VASVWVMTRGRDVVVAVPVCWLVGLISGEVGA
jgi:hypothetical protein